ncbi:hypothetical protein D3C72_2183870 [compost metagenome]
MRYEKEVFIMHVLSTVERQLEIELLSGNKKIITAVEFSSNTYQGILMYLEDIQKEGRNQRIILTEEVIPESLIVFKI